MAYIATTRVVTNEEGSRSFDLPANATVIGVELARTIPQGYMEDPNTAGNYIPQGEVIVRPTNVTATVGVAAGDDPSYILLKNGPQGGFTQNLRLGAAAAGVLTNAVVTGIITDQ